MYFRAYFHHMPGQMREFDTRNDRLTTYRQKKAQGYFLFGNTLACQSNENDC